MQNANSIVFVVGNGFDLALGYDSGYTHFVNTVADAIANYFWPFKQPDGSEFRSESFHQWKTQARMPPEAKFVCPPCTKISLTLCAKIKNNL